MCLVLVCVRFFWLVEIGDNIGWMKNCGNVVFLLFFLISNMCCLFVIFFVCFDFEFGIGCFNFYFFNSCYI